jgi:mannosyltransferase
MKVDAEAPPRALPDEGERPGREQRLWGGLIALSVGAAIATGVVLRFVTTSDLWLDEALTVNIARLPLDELPEALRHDGAPPLYYVLLHGWMKVFGTGDTAVRALSGVFGVLALPAAWFAGRRLGGRVVAWAAVLVLVTSPFAIRYATEARPYELQMLLVLLGYLAVCRALERPALGRLAAVAGVTGLLLYTAYWSIYLLALVGAGLVIRAWRGADPAARQAARSCLVAIIAGGVTFLPWLPTFLYQTEHTGTPWGAPLLPPVAARLVFQDFTGGEHAEAFVLAVPLVLLALLAVFGRAVDRYRFELDLRTRPGVRLVAGAGVGGLLLGIVASWLGRTIVQGRYGAVAFPLIVLVVAYGVTVLADVRVRATVLAVVVACGLVGGVRNVFENRTQAEEAASVIRAEARAGDVVVYCPDQVGPDVTRLLDGTPELDELTYPEGADPEFVDWVDYGERNRNADPVAFARAVLARAGPDHDIWYVNAPGYRHLAEDCERIGTRLSESRPEDRRVRLRSSFFEAQNLHQYPAR